MCIRDRFCRCASIFAVSNKLPTECLWLPTESSLHRLSLIHILAVHQPVDYCGAFIYGSLAYLLAVWQKNLCAVIVMHAVANALLGWACLLYTSRCV